MNEDKQKIYIAIGLIGILLALFLGNLLTKKGSEKKSEIYNDNSALENTTGQEAPSPTPTQKAALKPTPKPGYSDAIAKYPYRIQFSECRPFYNSPTNGFLSMKKGQPLMLDNRDPKAHTVGLLGKSYKLPAYDYLVVYPNQVGQFNVSCDKGGSFNLNVE